MDTAARLLAQYDVSDATLLELRVLPGEIELLGDFRLVSGDPETMNRLVRLRLTNPRGVRLDFAVPGDEDPDEVSQQLGRIVSCDIGGMTTDASVKLESAFGRIEVEHCALTVEPYPWFQGS